MAGHCHAEHMADAGRRLGVSMALTFAFVAFEAVVGMRSGSLALLSDAGHNFADAVALALSWYGLSAARRPATARRTYGFHRVAILAALANSVSLVIIALGIFWEACQRLGKPGEVQGFAMVWTAAAAILINGLISYWLHAGSKHDINIRSAYIHMLGDAVSAVGVVAAGLIISRTGWSAADPIVSLAIGALILYSSWGVLQEAVDVLMEATPAGLDLAAVEGDLMALLNKGRGGWAMVRAMRLLLAVCAVASLATAQEPPVPSAIRFARHPALSPDGRTLAFGYKGDIWTVPVTGGAAQRVTVHSAHDQLPAWSPDGKWLAFSSKREGNYDVYVIPAAGGTAKRLTYHSADDAVSGWSPDGAEILFASSREATRTTAIYAVNVKKGSSRLVRYDDEPLGNACMSQDGKLIACTRSGSWTRKGYRGSSNSDLMLMTAAGAQGELLTRTPHNERWPLFAPDGKIIYYVSDQTGAANIYRRRLGEKPTEQVTRFTAGTIFYPSIARDGSAIAFERDFGIWRLDLKTRELREIRVTAASDDRENSVRKTVYVNSVQEATLSPDGKQVAFIVHGEVFVQPASGGEAVRITDTPQREEDVTWSPNGKEVAFTSDRTGEPDIYIATVPGKETRKLVGAKETAECVPVYSPDGKQVLFLRGGDGQELCVIPAAGSDVKVVARGPSIGGHAWSPDGKWVTYHLVKSHSAGTIGSLHLLSMENGSDTDISRYPGVTADAQWSADGKTLAFQSNRSGKNQVYSLSLKEMRWTYGADEGAAAAVRPVATRRRTSGEGGADAAAAPPAAPVKVVVDLEEIHTRPKQVTSSDTGTTSYAISPDGQTIWFFMSTLGRSDLWKAPAAGGASTRITQSGESGRAMQFSPDGSTIYWIAGGQLKSLPTASAAAAAPSSAAATGPVPSALSLTATMDLDMRAELTQMFDEAWRKMRDGFYDEKMHGCDWNALRERYRPVVADITYREDFYTLFSLALGELNASHTGISGARDSEGAATAAFGVTFDDGFAGPGVKVATVVERTPAASVGGRLVPGDVVTAVDGAAVAHNEELYRLLADKSGKKLSLTVAADGKTRTVTMRPISGAAQRSLAYEHWVRERRGLTEKLSGGRFIYVHMNGMGVTQLEEFRRVALADAQGSDGLVLDLRFNGGGSVADEMFSIINNRVFGYRTLRGSPERLPAPMPASTKPMVVLINGQSFSNAEVFPWGFRGLGLGKTVGVPTNGSVIGTGSTTLIDGSSLRMPAVGSFTLDGKDMELNGCPADIEVELTPADIVENKDRQLEAAVAELLKTAGPARERTQGRK
ncbi:MAG: cation diffusion facilitator family transporter [Armatimonadetes bacterium]|nr:cation diffusion facilitator family transporter [Armatimonadota bacterium]